MEEALIKRVQPHDADAERAVIGAMLMDREAIVIAAESLRKEDFYQPQLGVVFEAIVEINNEGKPVDMVILQDRLKEKDVPPEISSLDFVRGLMDLHLTSANIDHYVRIVYEKALLRRLIRVNESIADSCYAGNEKVEDILEMTEKNIFDLLKQRAASDYVPVAQIALNTLERIEQAARNKSSVTGIPTGFSDLDYKLSGLQPSDLVLVAARPSMGKTAFVLNIAQYTTLRKDYPCAIFSLEMSKEQLMNRLFAMESRVDSQALRIGNLTDTDWEKLVESVGLIGNSGLIIDDTPGISVSELRSKCL